MRKRCKMEQHPVDVASFQSWLLAASVATGCKSLFVTTDRTTNSAWLIALDAATGKLLYPPVQLHESPRAAAPQSPTYYGGQIFVGVTNHRETCNYRDDATCAFRGTFMAIEAATGKINWKTYMAPPGYQGCGVWGSAPAIDAENNQVCIGTGNVRSIPTGTLQCLLSKPDASVAQKACMPGNAYNDAVVCLNINTGKVNWSYKTFGADVYGGTEVNYNQLFKKSTFASNADMDFAQAPIFISKAATGSRSLLLATGKAGVTFAFDPKSRALIWKRDVSAVTGASEKGKVLFGSCTNGKVYCLGHARFWIKGTGYIPYGRVTCLNVLTGKPVWKRDWDTKAMVYGPLTCTQNYVFAPLVEAGVVAVLDLKTGTQVGSYKTGTNQFCGPAIASGVMYVGVGTPYSSEHNIMAVRLSNNC